MERRGRVGVIVNRGIEELLAIALEVILRFEGVEKPSGRAKVRNYKTTS
jgi:hypothetical protein